MVLFSVIDGYQGSKVPFTNKPKAKVAASVWMPVLNVSLVYIGCYLRSSGLTWKVLAPPDLQDALGFSVSRGDFSVVCSSALAAPAGCSVCHDGSLPPLFALSASFSISYWSVRVGMASACQPLLLPCWREEVDETGFCVSLLVRDFFSLDQNDVDGARLTWSSAAVGLLRGGDREEGPFPARVAVFGRGQVRIR